MISVIIPTYKGSKFLPRAIDSVLLQDNVDFEVLVVDDNSPESLERKKTESVMKKYNSNKKIKYIKHKENLNGSAARNTGIRNSKGQFITFLDDDDFYMPNRLLNCLKSINENNVDFVYTDSILVDDKFPSSYISATNSGNLFKALLLNDMLVGTGSNLFFRKSLVDKFGYFNEKLVRHQDYEFLLRIFSHGAKAFAINKCFVVKATNGVNNQPNYTTFRNVKEQLGKEFSQQLGELPKEDLQNIKIFHHQKLLRTALAANDKNGIAFEEEVLKSLGYADVNESLIRIIRFLKLQNLIHKIINTVKVIAIKHNYTDEYRYIKSYMGKYD